MARLLFVAAVTFGCPWASANAELECDRTGLGCEHTSEDDVSSLLARKLSKVSRHGHAGDLQFMSELRTSWDSMQMVMMTAWGGLDGPLDDGLFKDTITWESAKEYMFVKDVSSGCDPNDINLDALCSEIAYISFTRKDLYNTYFSNDGNFGHSGRPAIVLKPSSWNSTATTGERVNFKQGWFIDSWPDYRFVSEPGATLTTVDRFNGLNYEPSGYRTNMSLAYMESIGMLDPAVSGQARSVDPPPYLSGNTPTANGSYFSYEAPLSEATLEAFIEYYGTQMNKTIGGFECFTDGGKKTNSSCNTGKNINFFQGFVDFEAAGLNAGLQRLAEFRKAWFGQKLYSNAPNGPPLGNEVELDAYPWKTEPPREQRSKGDPFTAYMIPYTAVGAVALIHAGPKWTLSTRPQPPHISMHPLEWGVDPAYYYLYKGFNVLYDGLVSSLEPGAEKPEKLEVSHILGTDYAGAELEEHIDAWIRSPEGPKGSDVFNPWVDFYAEESGPQYKIYKVFLPRSAHGGSSYYRVEDVAKLMDARRLAVDAGYGVWASACDKAGPVTLIGSPGDDDLYGGMDDDHISAFGATDRLTGGPGKDTFVVEASAEHVIVTDLQVGDALELEDCDSPSKVSITAKSWPGVLPPAGTPIYNFRGGDTYTVVGVMGRKRPDLVHLWRVQPSQIAVDMVRSGMRRVCQLTVKASSPPLGP